MIQKFTVLIALVLIALSAVDQTAFAQGPSVARKWNEAQLACIRLSLARPTIHALHLKRVGIAMYDAWAAYDDIARPYMLGQTHDNFTCPFEGIPTVAANEIEAYRNEAISYAAYTYMKTHYPSQAIGINPPAINALLDSVMISLGYSINYGSIDYQSGNPADLGVYIATQLDAWSNVDGTNEQNNYANQIYDPVNFSLDPSEPGNPGSIFPNQWQSINMSVCTDQAGNQVPCPQGIGAPALTPEWGYVTPFSLNECQLSYFEREGNQWPVYLDQGTPPYLEDTQFLDPSLLGPNVNMFKFGFVTTLLWHNFHNNFTGQMIDTSPAHMGNLNLVANPTLPDQIGPNDLPVTVQEHYDFYNLFTGEINHASGYPVNPITGLPYANEEIPMADFTRATAQYWADGPGSETPPGHWFKLLNQVSDSLPGQKLWRGDVNQPLSNLDWDIKSYFTLGGAVHDAAVACWSTKGAYDYTRPIMAIRKMADYGQCTNPSLPRYHQYGLPLIPNYIEQVTQADIDADNSPFVQDDLNEVKVHTWLGPYGLQTANGGWQGTQRDSSGWKLAKEWWTYQVATFITPPFQGYYSGHSTFSRTSAEVLTQITGSEYFPDGLFEYVVDTLFADTIGRPSTPVHLQWATYRDASDQCSLSRIFGGLHPPQDDLPGRKVGIIIGNQVVDYAERYMFANAPQVASVGVAEVNPESGAFDFSVAVQFDQGMNTSITPTVTAAQPAYEALLISENSYWENDSLYITEYSVPEGNGSLIAISFNVEGYEPAAWVTTGICTLDTLNIPLPYSPQSFDVDLKAPICSTNAASSLLTDANVGSAWQIALTFDEAMDTASFDFAAAIDNSEFNSNLSYQNVIWTDAANAIVQYTILDNNNELLLPVSAIFEGTDQAGNALEGCALNAALSIDTQNPIASIGAGIPDAIVSDDEALSGIFSLPIFFDDNMDVTASPEISFTGDDPTLNTLALDSIVWMDSFSCMIYFGVTDGNVELDNIVMGIQGLTDNNGNPLVEPALFSQPFAVDTRNPQITDLTLSTTLITASPGSMTIAVNYDEEMNNAINPVISLSEAPQLELSSGVWLNNTEFEQTVLLSATDFNLFDIDVLVEGNATDAAGNTSNDSTLVDSLDIQLVGVPMLYEQNWAIYPNPAEAGSLVTITCSTGVIERLEILDMLGKVVFASENLHQPSYVLTLPSWSAGCYYVRITAAGIATTRPLVISSAR
jgi:hypothetical protein